MLKSVKKYIFHFLLTAEFLIFSYTFLLGKNGIQLLLKLKQENRNEKNQIISLKNDISELKKQIEDWEDPFYKEKIAREKLQLSRKHEQIYYI